ATGAILEETSTDALADLVIAIYGLPSTPQDAAEVLEVVSVEKAVDTVSRLIDEGYLKEVAEILYYLTVARLNDIFAGLTMARRSSVYPYLSAETIARITRSLLPLPDLTVTSVEAEPGKPMAGSTVTVKATVKNIGNVKAANVKVALTVDGVAVDTATIAELAPDFSAEVAFTWKPSVEGTYTVKVVVDPDNVVEEISEENNVLSTTVTVYAIPPALPDLTVEFTKLPSEPVAGESYTVEVKVSNIGEREAGAFKVRLEVDGKVIGEEVVEVLAAGASKTVEFTWTPEAEGTYTLKATVDPENAVAESNEANNVATASVIVKAPPPPPPAVPWVAVAAVVIIIVVVIAVAAVWYVKAKRKP
ncbi:MAG: hypothetical protein DRJ97_07025, partial [Thermoprotei archaeon]